MGTCIDLSISGQIPYDNTSNTIIYYTYVLNYMYVPTIHYLTEKKSDPPSLHVKKKKKKSKTRSIISAVNLVSPASQPASQLQARLNPLTCNCKRNNLGPAEKD